MGFLVIHFAIMRTVFTHPQVVHSPHGESLPPEFLSWMSVFYAVAGVCIAGGTMANALSGWVMRARRNRLFSLIVAGFNCLQFPFGTAVGLFTFIVLLRDSVGQTYRDNRKRPSPDFNMD